MNARQLERLGVPRRCAKTAIVVVQKLRAQRELSRNQIEERLQQVVEDPQLFLGDPHMDALAQDLLAEAERRDHRKIGAQLDLFCASELVGPGLPMFTPKGTFLRNSL